MSIQHPQDAVIGLSELRDVNIVQDAQNAVGAVVDGIVEVPAYMEENAALAGNQDFHIAQLAFFLERSHLHEIRKVGNYLPDIVRIEHLGAGL